MSRVEKEPNFFLVGAAKSGTSSLADYISQHPEVYMSPVKEPFFFISNIGFNDYYQYLSLFEKVDGERAIGEASTGYLFDENAPFAIQQRFPHAKIIVILRNPVDMAFSLWRYIRVTGDESKSFEEAISAAERKCRKSKEFRTSCAGWWANYLYLERAEYFNQVETFFRVFGRKKVKVYIFENFRRKPETICQDVFNFLEVNSSFVPDCGRAFNQGGEVRSKILRTLRSREYPLLRLILPTKYRARIRSYSRAINIRRGNRSEMHINTKRMLENFYNEDIGRLESLLGIDIHEWKPTLKT